jgi:dUTP pyrophosphatase
MKYQFVDTWYYVPDNSIEAYANKRPGNDAGYDLFAAHDIWFWPFQTRVIQSNSNIHIPEGKFGRVSSRSGHAKRGWLTHAGTIDNGYSGTIGITQTNLSLIPRRIRKGERIAQLIFIPFCAVRMHEIKDLEEFQFLVKQNSQSDRGMKSYNSSGIF